MSSEYKKKYVYALQWNYLQLKNVDIFVAVVVVGGGVDVIL